MHTMLLYLSHFLQILDLCTVQGTTIILKLRVGICLSHADPRNLVARISLDSVIRFSFPTYPDDFSSEAS